ncbi:MAG: sugar transferase, partial [Gemmatimonadales bacterium]
MRRVPLSLPASAAAWLQRSLNLVLALLALLALLPVFVLLAILIKLTSRGPIFYLQERVGL